MAKLDDQLKKQIKAELKGVEKKFMEAIWANWAHRKTDMFDAGSSIMVKHFDTNPAYVAELGIVRLAMEGVNFSIPGFRPPTIYVHKIAWPKFLSDYYPKYVAKAQGNIPHMKRTDALKEFLKRGWIHDIDWPDWHHRAIYLRCHCGPLVWPELFDQHQDAMQRLSEMGIPGLCGTIVPKS